MADRRRPWSDVTLAPFSSTFLFVSFPEAGNWFAYGQITEESSSSSVHISAPSNRLHLQFRFDYSINNLYINQKIPFSFLLCPSIINRVHNWTFIPSITYQFAFAMLGFLLHKIFSLIHFLRKQNKTTKYVQKKIRKIEICGKSFFLNKASKNDGPGEVSATRGDSWRGHRLPNLSDSAAPFLSNEFIHLIRFNGARFHRLKHNGASTRPTCQSNIILKGINWDWFITEMMGVLIISVSTIIYRSYRVRSGGQGGDWRGIRLGCRTRSRVKRETANWFSAPSASPPPIRLSFAIPFCN